jgi:hypothetical protein
MGCRFLADVLFPQLLRCCALHEDSFARIGADVTADLEAEIAATAAVYLGFMVE